MEVFEGIIQKGAGQADKLFNLPTANIAIETIDTDIKPGVYVSCARINGRSYQALTFIGQAHLLPGNPWRLETHMFGASGDFIGQQLSVQLLHHQREAMPFTTNEQAATVIKQDIVDAHRYFANNPT